VKDFAGKIGVITGGGTGMGRELARQLVAQGCDVAMCDVSADNMAESRELCEQEAPQGIRLTTFRCDVSDAGQMDQFAEHVRDTFDTAHINLLFNNAGIAGAGSFVNDERELWEKTFNVCWGGVYNGSRSFMPMLVASTQGHIVNTSSINGFWASSGPNSAHTSYSAAKFAVKGFTEALVTDLRINAPHVKASVVMPGHIGTSILLNSQVLVGNKQDAGAGRSVLKMMGAAVDDMTDAEIEAAMQNAGEMFRDNAPTTAAQAATIILDGVKAERWRILVGQDAHVLDELVRAAPEEAYEPDFRDRWGEARSQS
jgi:NAD(P)-dependent dehydrogenase (short-subunit alcohol dehydrogenase family)